MSNVFRIFRYYKCILSLEMDQKSGALKELVSSLMYLGFLDIISACIQISPNFEKNSD